MRHFSSSLSTVNEHLNDFFVAGLTHFLLPLLRAFSHLDIAPYQLQRASITHTHKGIMTDILFFFIIARRELVRVIHHLQSMSISVHALHPTHNFTKRIFAHRFEFSQ